MNEKEVCMLQQMLQVSDIKFKKLIKSDTKKLNYFLCECFLNVFNGNVPIKKNLIETEEISFRKILSKQTSLKAEKKKMFVREID